MSQGGLHHPFRRDPAILCQQRFFQRPAVNPDAYGYAPGLAGVNYGLDAALFPYISGVDPNFIRPRRHRLQRQAIVKMNIRHQRNRDRFLNFLNCAGRFPIGHRHPYDLTAGALKLFDLGYCGLHVTCAGICHRLNGDGRAAAHGNATHQNLFRHKAISPALLRH